MVSIERALCLIRPLRYISFAWSTKMSSLLQFTCYHQHEHRPHRSMIDQMCWGKRGKTCFVVRWPLNVVVWRPGIRVYIWFNVYKKLHKPAGLVAKIGRKCQQQIYKNIISKLWANLNISFCNLQHENCDAHQNIVHVFRTKTHLFKFHCNYHKHNLAFSEKTSSWSDCW